jgi:hypothetical protein
VQGAAAGLAGPLAVSPRRTQLRIREENGR